jgi:two-component system NarL family response regulator
MRILLADDNRLLLEGLTNLLSAHGLEVVATASDGFEAVIRARVHRPDLVLMDVRMPRCDGLAATRLINAEMPEIRVVMLTTSADDEDLFEAIRSGAFGYLLKNVSGDELIEALAGVEDGVPPMSPGLAGKLLHEFARRSGRAGRAVLRPERDRGRAGADDEAGARGDQPGRPHLTLRQSEVLELVAAGLTYKEVAAELRVSERTVRYHMGEILTRFHLQHRSQVLAYAGETGMIGHHE